MGTSIKRMGLCTVAAAVLASLFAVTPAFAQQAPWWHLLSVTRPTNIHAGASANEVQEINAEPASAFELEVNGAPVGIFESYPYVFAGGFTQATSENIQTALETAYGSGNVVVSGGPAGSSPLTITSVGEDAGEVVAPITVPLSLPSGSVKATVVTDGELVVTAANVGDATVNGNSAPVEISDTLPPGPEGDVGERRAAGRRRRLSGGAACVFA